MPIDSLPEEILECIFETALRPALRLYTIPRSHEINERWVVEQAQVDVKTFHKRNALSLSLVCKKWRKVVWKEINRFVVLPYSPLNAMVQAMVQLRRVQFGRPNGDTVKDLYLASGSPSPKQYLVVLLICWTCTRVESLTISEFF